MWLGVDDECDRIMNLLPMCLDSFDEARRIIFVLKG